MSWSLANLHDFAALFWDELGGDDAMYVDRQISRLWVTGDGERDIFAGHFGAVVTARLAGA